MKREGGSFIPSTIGNQEIYRGKRMKKTKMVPSANASDDPAPLCSLSGPINDTDSLEIMF